MIYLRLSGRSVMALGMEEPGAGLLPPREPLLELLPLTHMADLAAGSK